MLDIELVVKIPKRMYKKLLDKGAFICLDGYEAIIANGTPLPKGHGRLIDADALMTDINTWCDCEEGTCLLKDAPTIIEADRSIDK